MSLAVRALRSPPAVSRRPGWTLGGPPVDAVLRILASLLSAAGAAEPFCRERHGVGALSSRNSQDSKCWQPGCGGRARHPFAGHRSPLCDLGGWCLPGSRGASQGAVGDLRCPPGPLPGQAPHACSYGKPVKPRAPRSSPGAKPAKFLGPEYSSRAFHKLRRRVCSQSIEESYRQTLAL